MTIKKMICVPALIATLGGGAEAATSPPLPPAAGNVLLLPDCPSERMAGGPTASAGIFAALGLAVIKNLAVAAADAFAGLIEKRNRDLSAVSSFEGFGWFYGPGRMTAAGHYDPKASAAAVTSCIVVVRYGNLPEDPAFSKALGTEGAKALADVGVLASFTGLPGGPQSVATPVFYTELKLEPAEAPGTTGPLAYGFRLRPTFVYFGRSAAKMGRDHPKTLRLELSFYRYLLDKGQLAEKAYYTGAFDLGRYAQGSLLADRDVTGAKKLDAPAGSLALYPAPADIKAGTLRLMSVGVVQPAATITDPVMFSVQARFIEAEDPSILMKAIESAVTDNKTKIADAAASAATSVLTK